MSGSLKSDAFLKFGVDGARGTFLSERQAGGLFHFSKAYRAGGVLGLQMVNPTAGLFANDEMNLSVTLEEGAQVLLSTPSATRFYAMKGHSAHVGQTFHVGPGACLEYHTNWVIPQRGSAVDQKTEIEIEEGGQMFFFDRLAPGRVQHGESYRYRRYETSLELKRAGKLQVVERMVLEPELGGWPLEVPGWKVCFYGAVWLVCDLSEGDFRALVGLERCLNRDGVLCGLTRQGEKVYVIRILAARSLLLKGALEKSRRIISSMFPALADEKRVSHLL